MSKWIGVINEELDRLFPTNKNKVVETENEIVTFGFQIARIAGQEVLYSNLNILHKRIELPWMAHIDKLLLQKGVYYPTISINAKNSNLANNLFGEAIVIGDFSERDIVLLITELFTNKYGVQLEYYRSLENCNKLINHDIKIKDGIGKFTSLEGLPFRKVILAEAVNDPRSQEIKEAMRNYCEENYELGKKNNFEQLCRLKLVFDTMFPRDNINNSV